MAAISFRPSFVRRDAGRSKSGTDYRGTRIRHEPNADTEAFYPTIPPLTKGRQERKRKHHTLKVERLGPDEIRKRRKLYSRRLQLGPHSETTPRPFHR